MDAILKYYYIIHFCQRNSLKTYEPYKGKEFCTNDMLKAYKYEIFPTKEQIAAFQQHFGCTRFMYNWGLEQRMKAHTEGKKQTCIDLINKLPELKETHPWLKEVNSQSLQMPLRNLDNAYTNFFKKIGKFPRFKSKHRSTPKFQCPQHVRVDFDNQLIS
jgi:putative transposase